jgi:hypothetical protein
MKMKQWFPIISLHSVISQRTRYRDLPSNTWSLLRDKYTLPWQTYGTPTFQDLSVEFENIFKAKLWYHISNSTMTKHCCLHIQSSNAWQTTDQNSLTVCFFSKLHSQLGGFKITLSSVCARTQGIAGIAKTSLCILIKFCPMLSNPLLNYHQCEASCKLCISHTDLCCGK